MLSIGAVGACSALVNQRFPSHCVEAPLDDASMAWIAVSSSISNCSAEGSCHDLERYFENGAQHRFQNNKPCHPITKEEG